jgi:hypothetical protein
MMKRVETHDKALEALANIPSKIRMWEYLDTVEPV